ncbi:hypothetical protein C8F01DRAFT_1121999 [Mycena amicta]|nr:hypothetical protein C8F01DRAFT_1121999 [Mycena amicta]
MLDVLFRYPCYPCYALFISLCLYHPFFSLRFYVVVVPIPPRYLTYTYFSREFKILTSLGRDFVRHVGAILRQQCHLHHTVTVSIICRWCRRGLNFGAVGGSRGPAEPQQTTSFMQRRTDDCGPSIPLSSQSSRSVQCSRDMAGAADVRC